MQQEKTGQYFVTLNIDELFEEDIEYFKGKGEVVAYLSKEKDEERFMGIRYN